MVFNSSLLQPGDHGGLSPQKLGKFTFNHSLSFKEWEIKDNKLEANMPSISCEQPIWDVDSQEGCFTPVFRHPKHLDKLLSPRSVSELEEAATVLQKVYKSYRTRRNLADCAVIVEELWWKAVDFATLRGSSVSFFGRGKPETVASRWARAGRRAAKVGKGLSKDEKAQKLALRHWLEAIDPRHRYGHNLHIYYDVWYNSESDQPFFYWLDVGDGKDLNLEKCPRDRLLQQCIRYLGPNEREAYEVIPKDGKFVYKKSGLLVDTTDGLRWIFVLSTSKKLYVGKKQKGKFQHSSFLAGGVATAAGRLVVQNGTLMAIEPYSGHYRPTAEHFNEFKSFLKENNVDLTSVKIGTIADEEDLSYATPDDRIVHDVSECSDRGDAAEHGRVELDEGDLSDGRPDDRTMHNAPECSDRHDAAEPGRTEMDEAAINSSKSDSHDIHADKLTLTAFELGKRPSCRWTTGAGARIGCVRDYPPDLQAMALEQVCHLSPQPALTSGGNKIPIPSPRPSARMRCSPRVACMGLHSPRNFSPVYGQMVFPTPTVSLKLPPLRKGESVA